MAKLPVIFRKWPESEGGDIIALFPTMTGTNDPYTCNSYEHVGQHGSAEPIGVIQRTKLAKPSEYADLLKELHQIGYRNLDVKQKYQHSYLEDRRRELARMASPKTSRARYTVGGKPAKSRKSGGGGSGSLGTVR